jgi:PAS domain S-box-containing protein
MNKRKGRKPGRRAQRGTKKVSPMLDSGKSPRPAVFLRSPGWQEYQIKRDSEINQTTAENLSDSVFWIGPDGRFLYLNEAACRILGYSRKQLLTMSIFDIDPGFSAESWADHWENVKRQGSLTFETRHKTRDGKIFYVEVNASYFFFDDKEYNRAYARDITDRMLAEDALRESEAKFRMFSEKGVLAVAIIQDGLIKYANRAMADIIGYTVEEILAWGKNEFAKAIHPDDRPFAMEQAEKKQRGEKDVVAHYSYRIMPKSGGRKWVEQYSKTVPYEGRTADFVSMIDITERRESDEVLQKAHRELEFLVEERTIELTEINRQLRRRIFDLYTIFELSRNFNAVLNYETLLDSFVLTSLGQMGAGKAALYLPGEIGGKLFSLARVKGPPPFPEEELIIDPEGEFGKYITAYNRPLFIDDIVGKRSAWEIRIFKDYFRRGLVVPLIFQTKLRGILIISEKESGQKFLDEDIEFLSILANQTAVSIENARLYESEKEALAKLQRAQRLLIQSERLAVLGEFSAKIAHEVNNPLGIIKNYLNLLARKAQGDEKSLEYIEVLRQEIQRITLIVRQLLNMGRPVPITFVKTDMGRLLKEVVELIGRQMEDAGISVTLNLEEPLPDIMAWPDGLKQVFMNLLMNAKDAIFEKGAISIEAFSAVHLIRIYFRDTGPGVDPEHVPHIFESFYSTKDAGVGTGLGLSVCRNIVKNHNGKIEYIGTEKGGCFRIELPVDQENSEYDWRI